MILTCLMKWDKFISYIAVMIWLYYMVNWWNYTYFYYYKPLFVNELDLFQLFQFIIIYYNLL